MMKSLRARNVALLVGIVLIGQLLAVALLYVLAIRPQAERVAGIMARNIAAVSTAMGGMSPEQRSDLIARLNAGGSIRILDGKVAPPEDRAVPTLIERLFMRRFAQELGSKDVVIWQGGQAGQLWVRVQLGDEPYWISYERPQGWTPNGALLASFLIAVTMALIAGLLIQRRIARPLRALAAAADATERDALPAPLPEGGPTELAAVTASFNAMRDRLAQHDSRRTHMLAAISHDLRTPLAKIRLELALLHDLPPESEAMIERQLDRLDAMLTQFLDFARGADSEVAEMFDIVAVLREMVGDLAMEARLDGSLTARVTAQPLASKRALANILRNAELYGEPSIDVTVRKAGVFYVVAIRDHGPGVSEADLERLHEPFFRTDAARSVGGGSGLGFAIAKQIATAQGGWLKTRNAPGGGLLVELALPITEDMA